MSKQRINMKSRADLENLLGYKFQKQELLRQALTHRSAIHEKHPEAFERDLLPLAFVGDAVLKYAVARYLFLNGKEDVIKSSAQLHSGAQTIIPNSVLAVIAREKLHLEEYLIRGARHKDLSKNMYAACMEAIFGAIALDCRNDQQRVIFTVIEKLCAQCYESCLKDTERVRFLSRTDEDEDQWITEDIIAWPKRELESAVNDHRSTTLPNKRSRAQCFKQACLWFFALFGLIAFCWVVIIGIIILMEEKTKTFTREL
jgi:dsRNA-specific ribonuclease